MKRLVTRDQRALDLQIKQLDKDMHIAMRMCDKQTQILKHDLKKRQRRLSLQTPLSRSVSAPPPPTRIATSRWRSTPNLYGVGDDERRDGEGSSRLRERKVSMGLSPIACARREVTSEIREAISLPCVIEESVWDDESRDDGDALSSRRDGFGPSTPQLASRKCFVPCSATTVNALATPVANRRRREMKERAGAQFLPPIATTH